tara:strand:+ start:983 stop:3250 length:2268 start_codon:yes stop_codon:yes gene_type:complete
MKKSKKSYKILKTLIFSTILIFYSKFSFSNESLFEIKGNKFTDTNAIVSLLDEIPKNIDKEYSNQIIKVLNNSNLFSDVSVNFQNDKYTIIVKEYPNIDNFYFENNERLKDEDLLEVISQLNFTNLNKKSINLFINETKKLYETFGFNDVIIEYSEKFYQETNTVDLYFDIKEGKITKINKIIIAGNTLVTSQDIREIIQSKTRSFKNIFANNNYKPHQIVRDELLITNYYKNIGLLDVSISTKIEYLESSKVNIYFTISEGSTYYLSSVNISDENNILSESIKENINIKINSVIGNDNAFSIEKIQEFKNNISSMIINEGIDFFEINTIDKVTDNNIDILFKITQINPRYTKQINIVGNNRTFDYVIRRELEIVEGDAIYETQIQNIRNKLISLNLFESVNIKEEVIDDSNSNLIIEVKEKQTGTFNAGVSLGTIDGFSIVTGLRERNFYGTGRSLEVLLNTSEDKNQFKLITSDRLSYENDANINYSLNFKQDDFSKTSSYKLDTLSAGVGIGYKLNTNLMHKINLAYVLKDYNVTNSSTVSNSILSNSGTNMSYILENALIYSTLNPGFITKHGNYLNYNNVIETPTGSKNGFIKNTITLKKYYNKNKNIFGLQTKIGNIFSLNNDDILTDDKFSLGGRWLRGFDSYGAGPRNSRTSYIGGNNIAAAKLDYSYEITNQSNFPIFLNIFNDYGIIWENNTKPTHSDNNLRSSAGFGIKYYSPVGPIGFTWGFPLMDEEYDIKRMFLFSIGNID